MLRPSFNPEIFQRYGAHPVLVLYDLFPRNPDSAEIAASLLTSLFVHAGILHVLFNMLFFHCFSLPVEMLMGSWRFAIFYLLCGVVGTLVHCLGNPTAFTPLVGASGAVAGVLGAHALLLPWARIRISFRATPKNTLPAWGFVAAWLALQVVDGGSGQAGDVAWLAHVGGIAAGAVLAPLFVRAGTPILAPRPDTKEDSEWGAGPVVPRSIAGPLAILFLAIVGWSIWQVPIADREASRSEIDETIAAARIEGAGVPRDVERGLALYREVARREANAAARLAGMLQSGALVPKNEGEAWEWYRRAADMGQPDATIVYALALIDGTATSRDFDAGVSRLEKLAQDGSIPADLQLGLVFENGRGTTVDLARAAQYYRRGCDSPVWTGAKAEGHRDICRRWAEMLANGRGVPREPEEAKTVLDRLNAQLLLDAATRTLDTGR